MLSSSLPLEPEGLLEDDVCERVDWPLPLPPLLLVVPLPLPLLVAVFVTTVSDAVTVSEPEMMVSDAVTLRMRVSMLCLPEKRAQGQRATTHVALDAELDTESVTSAELEPDAVVGSSAALELCAVVSIVAAELETLVAGSDSPEDDSWEATEATKAKKRAAVSCVTRISDAWLVKRVRRLG